MRQTRAGRRRERDRGASLVEFALIIPLLTMFLFGIVQFGIAYDKQQSINSGAREGARLGALRSSDLNDISTRAVQAADVSAVGNDPKVIVYPAAGTTPSGVRCPGGTYSSTDNCASPTGIDQTKESLMPCGAATPAAYVRVVVSTRHDITIPFIGVHPVDIDSEAEFRCE